MCAFYPNIGKLVVINNSENEQKTKICNADGNTIDVSLNPYDIKVIDF